VVPVGPALPTPQSARRAPASQGEIQLSFAPVAREAAPAVVNIFTAQLIRERSPFLGDPLFGRFLEDGRGAPRERIANSLGSGVIVREDGVIVTNNHVIERADAIRVVLADRREYDARVLLRDPRTDLAVIKVDTAGAPLPTLPLADTRTLEVGDLVLAIGNPFGIGQSVTSGIVSATARTDAGITDYAFFIQTDAAINPGNSGGALVDLSGALVGLNTAIYSRSGGSNGIGFAIPSEMVRRVVESALTEGRVVRPWLGLAGRAVTPEIARGAGLARPQGVLVDRLFPNGPGAVAGLRAGDVVLSIDGTEVADEGGLRFVAATRRPGDTVRLNLLRGGRTQTLDVRVQAPPRIPPDQRQLRGRHPFDGATVVTVSPGFADEVGLDPFLSGVMIRAIARDGFAVRFGLAPGDFVREVNGVAVASSAELERALARLKPGTARFTVERNGERAQFQARL
jgi:Do/DeqQ family serine protease